MDVAVTDLRTHLSHWIAQVRDGHEIVVTERGVPVARMLGLTTTTTLEQLTQQGVISTPRRTNRPPAAGRRRPRAARSISDIVSEQRE